MFFVNDTQQPGENLLAQLRIYDFDANEVFRKELEVNGGPLSSQELLTLPELPDISTTYFLDLRLFDSDRKQIASNFYWLSTTPDVLDYEAKVDPWEYYTPSKQFADFTLLNSLSTTTVEVRRDLKTKDDKNILSVELKNTGDSIAFAIELNVTDANTGAGVVPVFWQDNYVSLMPGECRTVEAAFDKSNSNISLDVHGWNIEAS